MRFTLGYLKMFFYSLGILGYMLAKGIRDGSRKITNSIRIIAGKARSKMKNKILGMINPHYTSIALGLILVWLGLILTLSGKVLSGIIVIQIGLLLPTLHFSARIFLPNLAEAKVLVAGPKIGRIQGIRRGNKFICFIDNIVEMYDGKNWHVDINGVILEGRVTLDHSWFWRHYGVYPIGLNDIYTYEIVTTAEENQSGKLVFGAPVTASSIYFHGTYTLISLPFTKDGIRLKATVQIKTRTLNAATALSLPQSWTILVFVGVLATLRDFFGSNIAADLISTSHEAGINKIDRTSGVRAVNENSGFAEMVRQLNIDTSAAGGNYSLEVLCGQFVEAVTMVDIDFADETTEEAFWGSV
jgi:hypothetical protein